MSQRIVIVGGVAAGASAATKARRTHEQAEIVLIEAGPYVSFANCGLPYYVGGEIPRREDLFVVGPRMLATRFNLDVRVNTRVTAIGAAERQVQLRNGSGATETLGYDRLILATGTVPIVPPIEGLKGPNVFTCRSVPDADAIVKRIAELTPDEVEAVGPQAARDLRLRALVIGAGYIGLECAEQLLGRGFEVTLVELLDQLMSPLDPEMAEPLQSALAAAGVEVILGDGVARIERRDGQPATAVLQSGRRAPFDLAILGTGVRPNVALARQAGLRLGPTGAIAVDPCQRTSEPAIFAAGDNCECILLPTGRPANVPLAGPANKQGRIAGANAALDLLGAPQDDRRRLRFKGALGTAVVRVRDAVAGVTGLTEKLARAEGLDFATAYVPGLSHAGYYPGARPLLIKIVYRRSDGRLLGAQAAGGTEGVDKRIDVLATAIQAGLTVEDLEQLDLCYAPPFGSAKDPVVMAGFVAANALRGTAPSVGPMELTEELRSQQPPAVVDVRTEREYAAGHLEGALNVPLDEIRQRMDTVPAHGRLVLYCGAGYRSYVAQQILLNQGRQNVRNLLGGYTLLERAARLKQHDE